jgi:hypothetical protein
MHAWLVGLALLFVACGPSSQEVKTAKLARYSAPAPTLLDIAVEVAARDYKIGQVDKDGGRFETEPQMYNPEGGRQSPGAGGYVQFTDRSVLLSMLVEVLPAEQGGHVVTVTPRTFQMISGSPKPRELAPDDPNLPGWVQGRVETLQVAIYNAAKQHAIP